MSNPNGKALFFAPFAESFFAYFAERGLISTPVVQNLQPQSKLEARGGIEPPMRVLQTLALPLGHRAMGCLMSTNIIDIIDICE